MISFNDSEPTAGQLVPLIQEEVPEDYSIRTYQLIKDLAHTTADLQQTCGDILARLRALEDDDSSDDEPDGFDGLATADDRTALADEDTDDEGFAAQYDAASLAALRRLGLRSYASADLRETFNQSTPSQ